MRNAHLIQEIFDSIQKNFKEGLEPLGVLMKLHGEANACRIKYNNHQKGETSEVTALALYIIAHLDEIKGSLNREQLLTLVNVLTLSANYCDQQCAPAAASTENLLLQKSKVRARINAALTCLEMTGIDIDVLISEQKSLVEKKLYLMQEMKLQSADIEIIAQFLLYYGKFSRYECDLSPAMKPSDRASYVDASLKLSDSIKHAVLGSTASSVLYFIYTDLKRFDDARTLMIAGYESAMQQRRAFDAVICGCRAINALVIAFEKTKAATIAQAELMAVALDAMVSDQAPTDRENLYQKLPYYNVKVELLRVKLIQYANEEDKTTERAQSKLRDALQLWDTYFSIYEPSGKKKSAFTDTGVKPSHITTAVELFTKYASVTEDMQRHSSLLNSTVQKPENSGSIIPPVKISKWEVLRKVPPLVSTSVGNGPTPGVWLEVFDSKHRPWKELNEAREEWLKDRNSSANFFKYVENKSDVSVVYSKVFGERFAITFKEGLAYKENDLKLLADNGFTDITLALLDTMSYKGKPDRPSTSGYAVFVLDAQSKKLYCVPYTSDQVHHTSCTDAARTLGAGMIKIEKGCVIGIHLMSGHYKPSGRELYRILHYLHNQGVDISGRKLQTDSGEITLPFAQSEFLSKEFIQLIATAIIEGRVEAYIKNCEYKPVPEVIAEALLLANPLQTKEQLLRLHCATGFPLAEFALDVTLTASEIGSEEHARFERETEALKQTFSSLYTDFVFGRQCAKSDFSKEFSKVYFAVHDRFGTFAFNTDKNLTLDLREIIVAACVSRTLRQNNVHQSQESAAAVNAPRLI